MKKSLTTLLALVAGTILAHAQGTITIGNGLSTFLIETNPLYEARAGVSTPTTGLASARTITTANSFFYAVLTQTTGANTSGGVPSSSPTLNPFDPSWLDTGVSGKNHTVTRGGIIAVGSTTTAAGTWAAPTGPTYDTGSVQWYLVVGWSANFGTTWATAKDNLIAPWLNLFDFNGGYFGQSPLAYQVAGGGPNDLSPVNLWGSTTGIAGAGLTSGFALDWVTLDGVIIPEPSTFTLAAVGVTAMLTFRRRK